MIQRIPFIRALWARARRGTRASVSVAVWYAVALCVPLLVCSWQLSNHTTQAPLFAFYFGTLIVTWLAGLGPGLLSAVESTVLGNYFFLDPVGWLSLEGASAWTSAAFLLTMLPSVLLIAHMQQRNLDQQEYLRLTRLNMERASRLQTITNVLSGVTEPEIATELVVTEGRVLLGASAGAVALLNGQGHLELSHTTHLPAHWVQRLSKVDLAGGMGFGQAMASRQARWVRNHREAPDAEAAELLVAAPAGAAIWLPLTAGSARSSCHGVLFFCFSGRREFYQDERDLALTLAGQCAQALERARLFEETRAAANALRAAIHSRDDFLAVAGHELKTPLTALQLQVQGLQRQLRRGTVDQQRLMEQMQRQETSTARLAVLVNDLLDVSRISANRMRLTPEPMEFSELVNDVIGRLGDTAARAGCEVHFSSDGELSGAWDRTRLEQVVTNLLSNALKYGAGKPVDVRVQADHDNVVLTVTDRGIGIPPKYQQRIFERYERAVSEREFGGLGLGLWITRQIVEASGGSIFVRSTLGKGSEFRVELPAWATPQRAMAAHAKPD